MKPLLLIAMMVILVTACAPTNNNVPVTGSSTQTESKKTEQTMNEAKPFELSGSGDKATDAFHLNSGFLVVESSHTGKSNFIVKLMDPSGSEKLAANGVGNYKGKMLIPIPVSGDYLFNVKAEGTWNLKLNQSVPTETYKATSIVTGKGDEVIFIKLPKGNSKFTSKHVGKSNFIIRINGSDLIANGVGNYEGSVVKNIKEEAIYAISVSADGEWSIKID